MTATRYWVTWGCVIPLVLLALYFVIRWGVAAGMRDFVNEPARASDVRGELARGEEARIG